MRVKDLNNLSVNKNRSIIGNMSWLPGLFDGEDVFVVAAGPSLKGFDFDRLRGRRTIAVNHAIRYMPYADIACFIDRAFDAELKKYFNVDISKRDGYVVTSQLGGLTPENNVGVIEVTGNPSDYSLYKVYGQYSSGIMAIQLARLGGAARIYLLGVDCGWVGNDDHFHSEDDKKTDYRHVKSYTGDKQKDLSRSNTYVNMKDHFERLNYDNIIDCSVNGRLSKWKKQSIDEVLSNEQ